MERQEFMTLQGLTRGIPPDLEQEAIHLKKRAVSILEARCHNGPVWMDRIVQMISTIHDATTVNTGRKDRKTNLEMKKPYAVVQYHIFA
jgi:hypothetical protein